MVFSFTDGSSSIISDDSWKTTASPITFSSIYGGEDYDANLEKNGWE
jgi:alpha-L-rhamnosidase